MQGFYTEELRSADGRGPRIGFDVVALDGRKAPLAQVAGLVLKVGKYCLHRIDDCAHSILVWT